MIALDAYAVIAFLRDEPAGATLRPSLTEPSIVSAVNLVEIVDQLVRVYGRPHDDVLADVALLEHAGVRIVPVDRDIGVAAGSLRAKHYSRRRPVSLADCTAAATALQYDAALATSDPDLAALVRHEGGWVLPLPDSRGRLP